MKRTLVTFSLIVTMLTATIADAAVRSTNAPARALASTPAARQISLPIIGTVTGGTFTNGMFTPVRFTNQNGELALVGRLTGTLTNTLTGVVTQINQLITLPVTIGQATCEILDLSLGPLDLDLLGLVVHLDEVNLNITAESGPGNLLGNLLCAVAGLLDGGGPLSGVIRLLNNILRNL